MKPVRTRWILLLGAVWLTTACATVGSNFPSTFTTSLQLGKTTRTEVEKNLGQPFRTGLDSGLPTATYLYYRLGLFNEPITKDLTITYAPDRTVKAYTFNSNETEAERRDRETPDYNRR
jgi:hypothetical protein